VRRVCRTVAMFGGGIGMSISTRQKIGMLLICISVAAFVVAQIGGSRSRVIGSGSSSIGTWTAIEITTDVSWQVALPIILCGTIGVICALWPSRKPPILTK
jgi:hypothetical protein